jgi:hypothetical protein
VRLCISDEHHGLKAADRAPARLPVPTRVSKASRQTPETRVGQRPEDEYGRGFLYGGSVY